jgi:hypothetical protein
MVPHRSPATFIRTSFGLGSGILVQNNVTCLAEIPVFLSGVPTPVKSKQIVNYQLVSPQLTQKLSLNPEHPFRSGYQFPLSSRPENLANIDNQKACMTNQ